MAEAKAPAVSYLSGDDPDIIDANRRYQDALAKLTESLDVRKNRFFDPTLLAMAEGFLGPTQTGSFGEALGRVAGKLGPAEAAALKEKQDIAQQQVAVAGQGLELQRMKQREAELSKYLNDPQAAAGPMAGPNAGAVAGPRAGPLSGGAAPAASASVGPLTQTTENVPRGASMNPDYLSKVVSGEHPRPMISVEDAQKAIDWQSQNGGQYTSSAVAGPKIVGAPQGALAAMESNKPAGFENVEGIQVMPPNPNFMTGRDYVRLNRTNKNKSAADLIKEGQEIEQKRYRDKEGGVQDLATGKFYQFPTGKTEEIQLYGYEGTHKVDARTAARLSLLAANDDPAYHDLARRVVEGPRKRTEDGGKAGEPARLKSQQELELDKERKKKLQEAEVSQEVEDRKNFVQKARDADESITTANIFRRYATDPKAKDMFGILNNDKVSSGIATLIRDGIGIPGFTVGTKAIEDVMRNADLPAAEQAKYRTFLMYATQMQLQQSKYMKGAVSDFEQRLMANAGITAQDTPEAVRMKADLITRRAQFDRRVAREFKASKMTADQFLDSDKYSAMRDKYNEDLADLASGSKVLTAAPATAPATAPAAGGAQPSAGFIRDPATGLIRRKKPGE